MIDEQVGGTVSHGTLQPRDLIPAFMAVLDEHRPAVAERLRAEYQDTVDDPDGAFEDFVGWLMDDLFDALNEVAPDGMFFGAHDGDGTDFGFWPTESPDG